MEKDDKSTRVADDQLSSPPSSDDQPSTPPSSPPQIVICGAGIVGLTLALALHKQAGIKPVLYEQAEEFHDGVGAAIGMYPNGLRVIRDISPDLLHSILEAGCPYEYRRWMRHDGTQVAMASEQALARRDDGLHSVGIYRWELQKILYDAVVDAGITVHFGKRTEDVRILRSEDSLVEITFADGTKTTCQVLLGADGVRSRVREFVATSTSSCSKLKYTGTTCLFGLASWPRPERGICFPAATTSKCHGCFFPVSDHEQCFQFHFPVQDASESKWGVLGRQEGLEECRELASRLREEGWDEQFLLPLENVSHVVRFGFSLLEPRLGNWAFGPVVLLGDAAHPPVPYIGQGAQMGLEDAGTLAQLISRICVDEHGSFDRTNFFHASRAFENMRMRRTGLILKYSQVAGREQQRRANSKPYNLARETAIRLQVQRHGTLPLLLPGVQYDYKEDVANYLLKAKIQQQPSLFRFRYLPNTYDSQEMYQVPVLLHPGGQSPEEYRESAFAPRRLMTKISEVSRESSSLVGDDGDDRSRKVKHHKFRIDRTMRLRGLFRPGLPTLPALHVHVPAIHGRKKASDSAA